MALKHVAAVELTAAGVPYHHNPDLSQAATFQMPQEALTCVQATRAQRRTKAWACEATWRLVVSSRTAEASCSAGGAGEAASTKPPCHPAAIQSGQRHTVALLRQMLS